ncbi:metal-dependent hydrolase [Longibacter salinarum]|uniref:Metal-dependent hydrolase n=1 Tax=Longibacter salinarum TaxID=1850348 RepID=A0A2A8D1Y9_9BACT|nr:SprT family zinc-dependent metalloprotease [Longibacter salinarum]PEN14658.1 metal-dependent hydrolase [Longibacter salinarum]
MSTTSTESMTLCGREITYRVRRSKRAKRVRIRANLKGITVVLPHRASVDPAVILQRKASWVQKHLDKFARLRDRLPVRTFEPGAVFPLLGRDRTVRVEPCDQSHVSGDTLLDGDSLVLCRDRVQATSVHAELEHLYRETARAHYADRAQHFGSVMGLTYDRLQIRNQKTRWGSYSPRTGTLSMNYRLLMAPPAIVDYVIVHELAHVLHANHSAKFWRVVERYDPTYREKERWLDEHGPTLIFDGRHV